MPHICHLRLKHETTGIAEGTATPEVSNQMCENLTD